MIPEQQNLLDEKNSNEKCGNWKDVKKGVKNYRRF
jgi:hypothetical protein